MRRSGEVLVSVTGAQKKYRQGQVEVCALRGVDLEVRRGELLALAGPSGSGKTTLLNLIGALDRPSAGSVQLEGKELTTCGGAELAELRRDRIGFVFQAYNLLPVLSARENTELILELQGVAKDVRRRRAEEVLAAVGLGAMMDRRPSELSGGQQQRVAVARALAANPALILADEPTANLDSKTAEALIDLMVGLNRDQGVTFIFSSHDPKVIDRAARVVFLEDGCVRSERSAA